jgi:hypothetical protein
MAEEDKELHSDISALAANLAKEFVQEDGDRCLDRAVVRWHFSALDLELERREVVRRVVALGLLEQPAVGVVAVADDDGSDIGLALEAGVALSNQRVAQFLDGLRGVTRLIVADGIMHYALRRLSPGLPVEGLGEALSALAPVRARLRASDLYVIEPRAFHGDYSRLIGHYDSLRASRGCS